MIPDLATVSWSRPTIRLGCLIRPFQWHHASGLKMHDIRGRMGIVSWWRLDEALYEVDISGNVGDLVEAAIRSL